MQKGASLARPFYRFGSHSGKLRVQFITQFVIFGLPGSQFGM